MVRLFLAAALAAASLAAGCAHEGASPPAATVLELRSSAAFEATRDRLRDAITAQGFRIAAEIDHAAGAQAAGLTLAPTTLFIFGNPAGGTPLMQADPSIGLELPLKALVYQRADGRVFVAWSDLQAIAARHDVGAEQARIARIAATLEGIAKQASAP